MFKSFPARLDEIAREKGVAADRIEVWFADEARIGQKNKITRRWARARYAALGAIRSAHGLNLHLRRHLPERRQGSCPGSPGLQHRSHKPASGRNRQGGRARSSCLLLIDQAGWHLSSRLVVPPNITIMALPPKCLEINPVENIWQIMRDNWLSNRVFTS